MRFRKSNHSIYRTEYHLVWIPRYRRRIFTGGVRAYAQKLLTNLAGLEPDIEVVKLNAQVDHIHLVTIIPPRFAVAQVVSFIKTQSAKALKTKFPFLKQLYTTDGVWSTGYCVSSAGLNEKEILHYVEYQEKDDKGQLQIRL
jgi:putative transposase